MNTTIKNRLYFGLAAAILLVVAIGIISFQTSRQQNVEAETVKRAYQVLNRLETTQKIVVDMETGRRGYRSTNEKKFLQPYYEAEPLLQPTLQELERLVQDNSEQSANVAVVHKTIDQLLQFWQSIPFDDREYTRQELIQINESEKSRMDAVRAAMERMTILEKRLLDKREQSNRVSVQLATFELLAGILLILAIVLILANMIVKEFKNRRLVQQELQGNYAELEKLNKENSERNWLLTGVTQVNNKLQATEETVPLAQGVLDKIVEYLNLPCGAFYLFNEEKKVLELVAGHGLPANSKKAFGLNEGMVGQYALETEPVVVKNISPDFTVLKGATFSATPAEVVYAPILLHKELKGVIELLSLKHFTERKINFVKVIRDNIAVAIHSAQSREKVLELLKQIQLQTEALENQQEELRQAYEDLSIQTETLQASEEELKVQEEELRQINAELEEKNEALETARQALMLKAKELEVTGKYKSEFLANMSHELRTPLNSVLILAKLLGENGSKNLTAKQIEQANIIYKSGSDLLDLINDILDLSKIEAGKVDLVIEPAKIKSIATDMEQLFAVVAEEKSIHFTVKIDPDVPIQITTDKQKVEQVLKNLLSNAFKFTSATGYINLSFSCVKNKDRNVLKIAVSDTGIGISKDKQQVIFEAFQQADMSTSRKFGGTGLGLSITKELLRMLHGSIDVDSEEGKGSTFTISLPFALEDSKVQEAQQGAKTNGQEIEYQTKIKDDRDTITPDDKVILIIEDDQDFAMILRSLAREQGYKALVALKGDEGLSYAQKYKPNAIILDMNLPVMDGGMILKKLRGFDELKHIPVHIISASEENKFVIPGAFAYLKKPVQKKEIEKVFASLDTLTNKAIKKVLLISSGHLKDENLQKLIFERQLDIRGDFVSSIEQAIKNMETKAYDCIIADIGADIEKGIKNLETIGDYIKNIPVIVYVDKDLTAYNELQLKKVASAIVRNSSLSSERLMDELELFLYKVNPDNKQNQDKRREEAVDGTDVSLNGKKVLIVDDDMRNVFALTELLEQENMNVLSAGDGKEALDVLRKNKNVDIVLMDIMMPEMDGYQAIRHIRHNMNMIDLPIIALTAKAMTGDREKCIEAGASDYIAKPVDSKKLQSLMRVWLSK